MSREILRELISAVQRLRREPVDPHRVDEWAAHIEPHLAELELLAAVALPDGLEPAFEAEPVGALGAAGGAGPASPDAPRAAGTGAGADVVGGGAVVAGPQPAATGREGGRLPQPAPARTLTAMVRALRSQALSPETLVEEHLDRIRRVGEARAFIAVFEEEARRQARAAREALASGAAGPLAGVPVGVKDLMRVRGYAMTGGSRAVQEPPSTDDADAVARLREAGAVVVGMTNLHELAFGVTSENPHFGAVHNPRAPGRVAGGSSGGSAAALAAGLVLGALGTDTGGSIRIPAAACGVAGLKPTHGRVSRRGVLTLAWSLDHVGPMAATVADAAVLWAVMADRPGELERAFARALTAGGAEEGGPEGLPEDLAAAARLARILDGGDGPGNPVEPGRIEAAAADLRVGRPPDEWLAPLDPSVEGVWRRCLERLEAAGASVRVVELPPMAWVRAAQFVIVHAEASAFHLERLRTRQEALGWDVRVRLEMGRWLLATDYLQGQRLRRQIARAFLRPFQQVDVLLLPALPVTAPPFGARRVSVGGSQEPVQRALTRYTAPFNQSGFPVVAVPGGFASEGLAVGLQVVGLPGGELTALRAGIVVEALARQP